MCGIGLHALGRERVLRRSFAFVGHARPASLCGRGDVFGLDRSKSRSDLDERFADTKFASRYDRFLSSLITDVGDEEDVVSTEMAVFFSPSSKYASSLISGALGKAFSVQIIETDTPDISVASCLDGGRAHG